MESRLVDHGPVSCKSLLAKVVRPLLTSNNRLALIQHLGVCRTGRFVVCSSPGERSIQLHRKFGAVCGSWCCVWWYAPYPFRPNERLIQLRQIFGVAYGFWYCVRWYVAHPF